MNSSSTNFLYLSILIIISESSKSDQIEHEHEHEHEYGCFLTPSSGAISIIFISLWISLSQVNSAREELVPASFIFIFLFFYFSHHHHLVHLVHLVRCILLSISRYISKTTIYCIESPHIEDSHHGRRRCPRSRSQRV